jgi:hypothetical protein
VNGVSNRHIFEQIKDLDIEELRDCDRERFGGYVPFPISDTVMRRRDARRCNSQSCCDGPMGFAAMEGWASEASASGEDYRNGIERLMDAFAEDGEASGN